MAITLDTYVYKARLLPALIVLLPLAMALAAWFPERFSGWELLVALLGFFGATALLEQLARDGGRSRQSELFELWEGKPTTRALRHRHTHLDPHTLARCHSRLGGVLEIPPPSLDEEASNPGAADQVYESYARFLLEHTRSRQQYRIAFEENVTYGFRRNLWAMKPLGLVSAIAGAVLSAVRLLHSAPSPEPVTAIVTAVSLVLVAVWVLHIRPSWVRIAGDALAVALVAGAETLPATPRRVERE